MSTVTGESRFRVTGMDCASCGNKVDTAIRRLPCVEDVTVSMSTGTVKVRHAKDFNTAAVTRQVRNLGYGAESADGANPTSGKQHDHAGHAHDDPVESAYPVANGQGTADGRLRRRSARRLRPRPPRALA